MMPIKIKSLFLTVFLLTSSCFAMKVSSTTEDSKEPKTSKQIRQRIECLRRSTKKRAFRFFSEAKKNKNALAFHFYLSICQTTNRKNQTLLHLACEVGSKKAQDAIGYLIEDKDFLRTNINAQDADGNTPLHLAYRNNDLDLVSTLLTCGANQTIKNNDDKIPYQCQPAKQTSTQSSSTQNSQLIDNIDNETLLKNAKTYSEQLAQIQADLSRLCNSSSTPSSSTSASSSTSSTNKQTPTPKSTQNKPKS